ncbi:PF11445 domain protein [Burkholderia cenocepacia BC7]|nr:PF11445 domain protein [Burkholderia cenocepacia BC7]
MTDDATQVRATLDAWREQGADRLDPVRFHRIDALERRAAVLDGAARALLDARLRCSTRGWRR